MFRFCKPKKLYRALVDSNGRVYLQPDKNSWRLQMFKRRGYVTDRFNMKEGK